MSGEQAGRTGPVRLVNCVKFKRELPGLEEAPWPGELGRRIYANVSAEAWEAWEDRMRMILNEYRLVPWQPEAQEMMAQLMEQFFFGDEGAPPPGFVEGKQGSGMGDEG